MNKPLSALVIGSALFLSACQTATDALDVDDVRKGELVAAECAIYFTVEAKLARENRNSNGKLSDSCIFNSGSKAANIAPNSAPEDLDSRYATLLYQRMIARGMPKDIADEVKTSIAFYNLVKRSDELNGRT